MENCFSDVSVEEELKELGAEAETCYQMVLNLPYMGLGYYPVDLRQEMAVPTKRKRDISSMHMLR